MRFRELTETFERERQGMGFETLQSEHIALAGGFRSGNSPPGLIRCMYQIIDLDMMKQGVPQKNADIGVVELYKDGNDDIRGLINIKLNKNNRKAGAGREIINSLIEICPTDFAIWDIRKTAVGFWKKMGCEFYTFSGKPVDPKIYKGVLAGVIRKPGSNIPVNDIPGFHKSLNLSVSSQQKSPV